MKKLLTAALAAVAMCGYSQADDNVAPAKANHVGHPFKVLTGADDRLAGQTFEIEGYSKLFVPAVGSVKLGQNGGLAAETKVGPGGVYQVPGLNPGRYTFVINTPQGFATFGQYVDKGADGANPIGVETGLASPADYGFLRDIAMSTPTSGLDADGGQVIPAEVLSHIENTSTFGLEASGVTQGYLVVPNATGARAADHMMVWFVRDGQPVASGETNDMGLFKVSGLTAGWYTMIASGKYGFLAISAEVAPVDGVSVIDAVSGEGTTQVWVQAAGSGVSAGSPGDQGLVRANLPVPGANGTGGPVGQMAPGAGGGAGGGGGGFGGGGGLGALGALLGAAGLGLGAAALADDDKIIIISPPGP